MKATQLKLDVITQTTRNTDPELFRREGSRFWQARFVWAGILHRRTTGTIDKKNARIIASLWRRQIIRRGKPKLTTCNLEKNR